MKKENGVFSGFKVWDSALLGLVSWIPTPMLVLKDDGSGWGKNVWLIREYRAAFAERAFDLIH